jgi:hypothetical protein
MAGKEEIQIIFHAGGRQTAPYAARLAFCQPPRTIHPQPRLRQSSTYTSR